MEVSVFFIEISHGPPGVKDCNSGSLISLILSLNGERGQRDEEGGRN